LNLAIVSEFRNNVEGALAAILAAFYTSPATNNRLNYSTNIPSTPGSLYLVANLNPN